MSVILLGIPLIIICGLAIYFFIIKPKSKSNQQSESAKDKKPIIEEKQISSKEQKEQSKKELQKQKQKQQLKSSQPMETAERYMNVGNTTPISISFDPTGKYFIVPCRNRQQILFDVDGIDKNANGKQRYRLTDDMVVDCSLFINDANKPEVALALDRGKSIQSFVLIEGSNKFEPGKFNVPNAGKLTVDKIKVAHDQSFVAALGDETYIRVFLPNGNPVFGKDTSQMKNTEISVSCNSELVAASSFTSEIVVYGVDRDRSDVPAKVTKAFTFSGHKNSIQSIDFDLKQLFVASGSKDCKYGFWLAPTRWREGDVCRLQWSGSLPDPVFLIRICPTSELLAIITEKGKLYFCDKSGIKKTVEIAHNAKPTHMEWSPNGKWVVVLSIHSPFIYAYSNPLNE